MSIEKEKIYPNCPIINRIVEVGGFKKSELVEKLQEHSIQLNEYGERLLNDGKFTTSETRYSLQTVELAVRDLGFSDGAVTAQIFKKANEVGLKLCPLELGPYLRLQYLDQPEGHLGNPIKQHQAPAGSITIASEMLSEDHDFPKGFYLRRMNGVLWLRGYIADDLHIWSPDDHFIFCQK
ncbi:helicase [Paenibacillus sp. CAA11]|uniref:helicase n=1 Tax=Paenibacillus sp. CAA11 TaxID=1532905 RepID=UPI000D3C2309|nr:helicase [Paenibacillus sp. CAA11]AWB46911.1 helicase [Paenibacillus sp. CAA11]